MNKALFILLALTVTMSSCVVSKKKYDALLSENGQLNKELKDKTKESQNLQVNLENAISDYESMKGDFNKSNALKSDEISDLMIMVTQLKDESEKLSNKLDETVGKFKAKEADSYMATEELTKTIKTVTTLKRDTASLNYSLQLAKKRNKMLQDELRTAETKASESGIKRVEIQKQLEAQSAELKNMELKLVKSQQNMTDISKAFIDLRKELLKAKSSNAPIDPNANKQIDKIAKLLGHY